MVQDTSLEAFFEINADELGLGQRQLIVYSALLYLKSASNAMIGKHLRLPINCITPRIFELREKGLVEEDKKAMCKVTNRNVIFWKLRERKRSREKVDLVDIKSYNTSQRPIKSVQMLL